MPRRAREVQAWSNPDEARRWLVERYGREVVEAPGSLLNACDWAARFALDTGTRDVEAVDSQLRSLRRLASRLRGAAAADEDGPVDLRRTLARDLDAVVRTYRARCGDRYRLAGETPVSVRDAVAIEALAWADDHGHAMKGTTAALVAIALGLEPPASSREEFDGRRRKWDERLRAAPRRLAMYPAADDAAAGSS